MGTHFTEAPSADRRVMAEIVERLLVFEPRTPWAPAKPAQGGAAAPEAAPAVEAGREVVPDHPAMPDPFEIEICNPDELRSARQSAGLIAENGRFIQAALDKVQQAGFKRWLTPAPELVALERLARSHPNFVDVVEYILRQAALSMLEPRGPLALSPILLVGPPGCGKTSFVRALGPVLGVPLVPLQLGHASAPFALSGLDPQYSTGGPGLLFKRVAMGPVPDPLVLLDEIDKVSHGSDRNVLGALYTLLEPSTAKSFVDDGARLAVDMSHIRWVGTANSLDVEHALLSRFVVFEVEQPSSEQLREIARSTYRELIASRGWGVHFDGDLPAEVAQCFADLSRRGVERMLRDALGNAALAGRRCLRPQDLPRRARGGKAPIGFV